MKTHRHHPIFASIYALACNQGSQRVSGTDGVGVRPFRLVLGASVVTIAGLALPLTAAEAGERTLVRPATTAITINTRSIRPQRLATQVVTTTRLATPPSNLMAQTTVINQEALKTYSGLTVTDALKQLAGISVKQSGGQGTSANFFMRGYDGKQVLVLIDGVRFQSQNDGVAKLNLIPVDQIERIEVMYGNSGSSIYGADAMGGVIQLFTKGQEIDKANLAATVGVGTQGSYHYGATVQHVLDGATLSLGGSRTKTDGINATQPDNYYYNSDKDGFESDNLHINAVAPLTETIDVGVVGILSESTSQYDSGDGHSDTHQDQTSGAGKLYASYTTPMATATLSYGHSIDESKAYDTNSPAGNEFKTEQQQIDAIYSYRIHQWLQGARLIGGTSWLNQSVDSALFVNDERTVKSGFLGVQLANSLYDGQAHLRIDDSSQYGSEVTYNLGGAVNLNNTTRVGTSFATGFRAPTLNELYNDSPYYLPNQDLNPESNQNFEVFAETRNALHRTRMTGYYSTIDDLIVYQFEPTVAKPSAGIFKNIDESEIMGLSFQSDWKIRQMLLGFSYDFNRAEYANGANKGNQIIYRPEMDALAYIGTNIGKAIVKAELEYQGKRYTDAANTDSLDDYILLNLSSSMKLTDALEANARINNVTDKDYVSTPTYSSLGLNGLITLTYRFF